MTEVKIAKVDMAETIVGACDLILALILAAADNKEEALQGVAALNRDMVNNVKTFYEEVNRD